MKTQGSRPPRERGRFAVLAGNLLVAPWGSGWDPQGRSPGTAPGNPIPQPRGRRRKLHGQRWPHLEDTGGHSCAWSLGPPVPWSASLLPLDSKCIAHVRPVLTRGMCAAPSVLTAACQAATLIIPVLHVRNEVMCSGSQGKKGPRRDSSPFYEPLRARWFLVEEGRFGRSPGAKKGGAQRKGEAFASVALAGDRPWVRRLAVSG